MAGRRQPAKTPMVTQGQEKRRVGRKDHGSNIQPWELPAGDVSGAGGAGRRTYCRQARLRGIDAGTSHKVPEEGFWQPQSIRSPSRCGISCRPADSGHGERWGNHLCCRNGSSSRPYSSSSCPCIWPHSPACTGCRNSASMAEDARH